MPGEAPAWTAPRSAACRSFRARSAQGDAPSCVKAVRAALSCSRAVCMALACRRRPPQKSRMRAGSNGQVSAPGRASARSNCATNRASSAVMAAAPRVTSGSLSDIAGTWARRCAATCASASARRPERRTDSTRSGISHKVGAWKCGRTPAGLTEVPCRNAASHSPRPRAALVLISAASMEPQAFLTEVGELHPLPGFAAALAGHAVPDHLDGVRRRESADRVAESAQVRERRMDRIAETTHQQRQRFRDAGSQTRHGSFEGFPEFRAGAEEADPRQRVQALLKDVVRCVHPAQSGVDGLDQQTVRGVDVPDAAEQEMVCRRERRRRRGRIGVVGRPARFQEPRHGEQVSGRVRAGVGGCGGTAAPVAPVRAESLSGGRLITPRSGLRWSWFARSCGGIHGSTAMTARRAGRVSDGSSQP